MVDSFQILLFVVIVALTLIISLIGIQVFLVLHEFRRVVRKVNSVADDAKQLSESALISAQNLAHSLGNVGGILSLLGLIQKKIADAKGKNRKK